MVSFVKPNLLGTLKEFSNSFIRPIENGQCADSTTMDVKIMKRRCHVLHKMLEGCVQVSKACTYCISTRRYCGKKQQNEMAVGKYQEQILIMYKSEFYC